jgi:hypothetical protein
MRVAEQGHRPLVAYEMPLRPGDQLVEQRKRVAWRPASCSHDEREHAGLDFNALLRAQRLHVLEHRPGRNEPERIVVRTRADRADDLLGLRGREDELDVVGRLFDELQKGVEPPGRDHVRLVDDEDLEAIARRSEDRPFTQVAGVVDATVARSVDLHDIE